MSMHMNIRVPLTLSSLYRFRNASRSFVSHQRHLFSVFRSCVRFSMLHSSLPSWLRAASGLLGLYNTVGLPECRGAGFISAWTEMSLLNRDAVIDPRCRRSNRSVRVGVYGLVTQQCHYALTAFSSFMCLCFDNQSLNILMVTCWSWTLGVPAVCWIKGVDLESC